MHDVFIDLSYFEFSGQFLASFYLDPYSRPSEKRGGAWMDPIIGKMILSCIFGLIENYIANPSLMNQFAT